MRSAAPSLIAFVLFSLLSVMRTPGSMQGDLPDRSERSPHAQTVPSRNGEAPPVRRDEGPPDAIGPAPRLDPITRFLPPIDPWIQSGLGWGDEAVGDDGRPLCSTNHPPTNDCDPAGPRSFLHAGFDAAPAADKTVRASAAGRVVSSRNSFSSFDPGRPGEGGGVVLLEHDIDGDPGTRDDILVTIYEHVDPLVLPGEIVRQGQVIARTSAIRGEFLHFGVRRAAFDPADPDFYRGILPPPGTTGCAPCFGKPSPLPAFPERWEDPAHLLRNPSDWAELLDGGEEGPGDVVETPEGYLVGGWTRAANIGGTGASDMWLVRLDSEGRILSQRAYGGPGVEEIRRLLPTADGGTLALARSGSFGPGSHSPMLVKFDATAEQIQWQQIYVSSGTDWGNDLRATSDGGYVMVGATLAGARRATVIKLDAAGGVQWAKAFQAAAAGPPNTDAVSVAETADGGYVVACRVFPGTFGGSDLLVFRLDSTGQQVWSRLSASVTGADDEPGDIVATSDGGFAIVGGTDVSSARLQGLWLLKLRADGTLERESIYSTFGQETGTRMVPMPDGGYALAGRTFSVHHDHPDLWVLRVDAAGQIVRQRAFDGRGAFDEVRSLRPTRDGGFVISGGQDNSCSVCPLDRPPSNLVVVKTNADLEVSQGCGVDTGAFQAGPRVSIFITQPLQAQTLTVVASPTSLTVADTSARSHACDDGAYGAPPIIQAYSAQIGGTTFTCDYTRLIQDVVCTFGIAGAQATLPVILSGSVDALSLEARVIDADSTPDRSDIVAVEAEILQPGTPFPLPIPLLDDGSSTTNLQPQREFNFAENCFDDPYTGACVCLEARYPTTSGDIVRDSVYTHRDSLLNLEQSRLFADCTMSSSGQNVLFFPQASNLEVFLKATDRLGNVSLWPAPIRVTTGINALECSGDACGCCLLLSLDRGQNAGQQCAGLEGMPSPQYPCGICMALPERVCGP